MEENKTQESVAVVSNKLTDEQLQVILTECQANVGHKCQAFDLSALDWADGYIKAAAIESRARKVFYTVRFANGKESKKVYNNPRLRISDELADVTTTARTPKGEPKGLWDDDDEIKAALDQWAPVVGKLINLNGEVGRIEGLVVEKRAHAIQLRVALDTRTVHKTAKPELEIYDEFDEEGQAMNDAYMARLAKGPRKVYTPEEKLAALINRAEKLSIQLSEVQAKIKTMQGTLEIPETQETEESIDDLV